MQWIYILAPLRCILFMVELVALHRVFGPNGMYGRQIHHPDWFQDEVWARNCLKRLAGRPMWLLLWLRSLAAVALFVLAWVQIYMPLLALVVFLVTWLHFEVYESHGIHGFDQMTLILFGVLTLHAAFESAPYMDEMCLWFLALQLCISYAAAGLRKCKVPVWKSGRTLYILGRHSVFKSRILHQFTAKFPRLSQGLSWGVILMQMAFPLVLFSGQAGLVVFLGWGLVFHLMTGWLMGLPQFSLTWPVNYLAVCYVNSQISTHVWA